jgi:hypothetical protein
VFTFISTATFGQENGITLGKNSITLNEEFTITLTLPKSKKREFHSFPYSVFPQIDDMIKKQTEYHQDVLTKEYKITQFYAPRKAGTFTLAPFTLPGIGARSKGLKIKVSASDNKIKEREKSEEKEKGLEFKTQKDEVFLKVFINKTSVYINEGVSVSVALIYNSASNSPEISFIDLNDQISTITKKIKPPNCWIEEQDLPDRVRLDTLILGNKKYSKWNIYEGVFFPLDSNGVVIPSLDFKLIKYQTAVNPANTSIIRKNSEVNLKTPALKIKVKGLPPHPLKEDVSAGSYQMEDNISTLNPKTGKSFKYTFTLLGEGNISTIANPQIKENEYLEIYSPQISHWAMKSRGPYAKARSYSYYILPKEPGTFHLGDYLYWVYFDPQKNKYDTLSSSYTLKITGESMKNSYISSSDLGSFYNTMDNENNHLSTLEKDEFIKLLANFIILFMLVTTAILILKK